MAAFNVANPGAKEYLIVGGVALVGGYLWIRRSQKQAQPAAQPATGQQQPAQAQPQTVIAQGNGIPWQALKAFLLDHQSSPAPAAGPAGPAGSNAPSPAPVTVPNVLGKTLPNASSTLANAGIRIHASGSQTQGGTVFSQTPGGGRQLTYGGAYWPVGGTPVVDVAVS